MQPPAALLSLKLVNVTSDEIKPFCVVVVVVVLALDSVGVFVDGTESLVGVVAVAGEIVSGSTSCSIESGGGAVSGQMIRGQHSPLTRSMIHLSPTGFT